MIRMVLDTNVFVSALVFGGVPRTVLELADAGKCALFYSEPIQAEVRRTLAEKFDWAPAKLQEALPVVWSMGELVVPRAIVHAVPRDPDDDRIIECALEAKAAYIVSGDKDLLALGSYKSILVVTPREFLEAFASE
ncbi:MAG TPA: putative toxin-antitoxin system toxin component, PIN family [Candidatus Sulfotelmatobacter sp.]